jgi:hypothetical protein
VLPYEVCSRQGFHRHYLGVGEPQRDRHSPDFDRERIAPAEDAAVRHGNFGAFLETKRPQTPCFVIRQPRPVDRDNASFLAERESIECHANALPD